MGGTPSIRIKSLLTRSNPILVSTVPRQVCSKMTTYLTRWKARVPIESGPKNVQRAFTSRGCQLRRYAGLNGRADHSRIIMDANGHERVNVYVLETGDFTSTRVDNKPRMQISPTDSAISAGGRRG